MLRDYVKEGGSLLIFPSADYELSTLNSRWKSLGGFMPWKLTELNRPVKDISLRTINHSYPGFAPLRNIVEPERARFLQRVFIKPDPVNTVTVLAEFEDRKPAALSNAFGKGETVLFSFGLSSVWTDAPYRNFFAPMMHELSRYLCGRGERKEEYAAGTAVSFPLKTAEDRVAVTVPGLDAPVSLSRANGSMLRDTFKPGCYPYTLETEDGTSEGIMVFNPSVSEGIRISAEAQAFKTVLNGSEITYIEPGAETIRTIGSGRKGRSLRDALLLLAMAVLLAELYMSNSMAVRKWKASNAVS
jgi:hypothetical protein